MAGGPYMNNNNASSQLMSQYPPQPQPVTTTPSHALPRRWSPEDAAQHITVSDPVQHSDGLNKFTSYRVDVRPPVIMAPGGGNNNNMMEQSFLMAQWQQQQNTYSAVLRRYSDFLWLYERLHAERPGAIVPPLPEKQPVGRFSPAFVEDRRVNLERFLRRVAVHPELLDAAALETFLRADDVTFAAAKQTKGTAVVLSQSQAQLAFPQQPSMMPYGSSTSPKKADGLKRWFAEAKTSMTGDLVKSPDDDLFEEIQRYVHGLDNQMRNVSLQATGLVRKGKEIANGLFEFGLAFNLLGQSEGDALGQALSRMGETADRLSVLTADHAECERTHFEDPLQDYIKMIHAVKLALQRRHEKRLSYSTCLSDVEHKQAQAAKLRMQPGAEAKAYAANVALGQAQQAAEAARQDFATVSQRVLREVDRFKREKAEDMRRTVLHYIQLQVEYNKRMEQVWADLIPQLEQQLDHQQHMIQPSNAASAPFSASAMAPHSMTKTPMPSQPPPPVPFASQQTHPMVPDPVLGSGAPGMGDPSSMISVQYRSD